MMRYKEGNVFLCLIIVGLFDKGATHRQFGSSYISDMVDPMYQRDSFYNPYSFNMAQRDFENTHIPMGTWKRLSRKKESSRSPPFNAPPKSSNFDFRSEPSNRHPDPAFYSNNHLATYSSGYYRDSGTNPGVEAGHNPLIPNNHSPAYVHGPVTTGGQYRSPPSGSNSFPKAGYSNTQGLSRGYKSNPTNINPIYGRDQSYGYSQRQYPPAEYGQRYPYPENYPPTEKLHYGDGYVYGKGSQEKHPLVINGGLGYNTVGPGSRQGYPQVLNDVSHYSEKTYHHKTNGVPFHSNKFPLTGMIGLAPYDKGVKVMDEPYRYIVSQKKGGSKRVNFNKRKFVKKGNGYNKYSEPVFNGNGRKMTQQFKDGKRVHYGQVHVHDDNIDHHMGRSESMDKYDFEPRMDNTYPSDQSIRLEQPFVKYGYQNEQPPQGNHFHKGNAGHRYSGYQNKQRHREPHTYSMERLDSNQQNTGAESHVGRGPYSQEQLPSLSYNSEYVPKEYRQPKSMSNYGLSVPDDDVTSTIGSNGVYTGVHHVKVLEPQKARSIYDYQGIMQRAKYRDSRNSQHLPKPIPHGEFNNNRNLMLTHSYPTSKLSMEYYDDNLRRNDKYDETNYPSQPHFHKTNQVPPRQDYSLQKTKSGIPYEKNPGFQSKKLVSSQNSVPFTPASKKHATMTAKLKQMVSGLPFSLRSPRRPHRESLVDAYMSGYGLRVFPYNYQRRGEQLAQGGRISTAYTIGMI